MNVYQSNHPGTQVAASSDVAAQILGLNQSNLSGYFSNHMLHGLLIQPNCVGVRLYNLFRQEGAQVFPDGLLAVGVKEDGGEIETLYIRSHAPLAPQGSTIGMFGNRAQVISEFQSAYEANLSQEKFASFYSETMLNDLMTGEGITGIAFYSIEFIGKMTHVGVSTTLVEGLVPAVPQGNFQHRICDQPCPGHCAKWENTTDAEGHQVLEISVSTDAPVAEPYLFDWH